MAVNNPSKEQKQVEEATFSKSNDDTSKYIASSYENIKTDLIKITRDKLENILLKYLNDSIKRTSWVTPCSLFFTFLIALLTTTFNDNRFISADTMKAIFIILCGASLIWAIVEIVNAIRKGKKQSIENLIEKIAKNNG